MESKHGKKPNQKLKPYLVLQYLLKNSDENHAVSASEIVGYLQEFGISAERRSIYKDIEEINKAMLMAENDYDLYEAEEEIRQFGDNARYVVKKSNNRGFYIRERRFEFDEIRLAAESIYASKFLTEKEAKSLVDLICSFVSDYQAEQIKHDVLLLDRTKTNNKNTFKNIATINAAMRKEIDGVNHIPEKISFKYLKYTINDLKQQVERKQGERYVVSPYALLLSDGYYYLYGYNDHVKGMRTYRVDRMRDVQFTHQPREGAEEFAKVDMKSYTQRVFSMFEGEKERITLTFDNKLLDTIIDRFGTNGTLYYKEDNDHFSAIVSVEVSPQFFGWLSGFGTRAKIIKPDDVRNGFAEYIRDILKKYE